MVVLISTYPNWHLRSVLYFMRSQFPESHEGFQSSPITHSDIITELFGVSLKTLKDFEDFITNIKLGNSEVWLKLSEDKRQEVSNALCAMYKPFKAENIDDSIPSKVKPSDPIVQSVDINTKSTSCAGAVGASAMNQPKSISNFRPLMVDPIFDGVNISIPRKKWSMDTRLLKEDLTRILIWVKLHDVPIYVFEEDGISLIATFIGKPVMLDSYTSSMCNDSWGWSSFARCLIEVNSEADLVDVVTIGIPSLTWDGFTKETICVDPPIVTTSNIVTSTIEKTNDGFQMVGKRKKRKATASAPKKGATNVGNASESSSMVKTTGTSSKKDNIIMSNSYSALNDEEDDVENVYDESANILTKTCGSSSFTAAAG
ncbi:zinc knuckle CX2CX4HX4C containing protein [Tanacetum coccineum]